jgi:non-ribosomal peptide synthetase-like protein
VAGATFPPRDVADIVVPEWMSRGSRARFTAPEPLAGRAVYFSAPAASARTLVDILELTAAYVPEAAAVDDGQRVLTYRELWAEIEGLGTWLTSRGIGRGDRVGVCIESGTAELYAAILSVLWVGAAYVPVDVDDPPERAELVWAEAGVCAVLGSGRRLRMTSVSPRGAAPGRPCPSDDAWIIFTSGSTGTPKGVAVSHRSAAAFVDAEAGLFLRNRPLCPADRVLAGLSVAFDASCEEMWLAWRHGACLVPAPRSLVRSGSELGEWLLSRGISVVSTVPTLASLWSAQQLRGVRLLILGGEACPEQLAAELAGVCPEVWNTYGPTETTVVACAARLTGTGPVRIGVPLGGWQLAVVHPDTGRLVGWGEVGELVIAGVGTARYLDADKDAAKFSSLPQLGWGRAYRSGDMVRADPEGLSYIGRADTQVKIRGYRIELSEIESVLLGVPGIAQAVVSTFQARPGMVELVGYYSSKSGVPLDQRELYGHLRARLPAHMMPAYLQELPVIPMTTSGKADRKNLPPPTTRCSLGGGRAVVRPNTAAEVALAEALAEVAGMGVGVGVEEISVESHFFDDLGVNSLMMAHFCAGVRRRGQLPPIAMKDVYLHPTIRSLAGALARKGPGAAGGSAGSPVPAAAGAGAVPPARVRGWEFVLCGVVQVLTLIAMDLVGSAVATAGFRWVWPSASPVEMYFRAVIITAVVFLAMCGGPVLAKWALIGQWQERQIRIWSLEYVLFWTVKTLIRTSPLVLFAGSPLYLLYLRALGAKIGDQVAVFSRTVPICTDLISIGDRTVIRKGCSFTGYRAEAGTIYVGSVTLGRDVVVAESTHLDIGTRMGDGAQLGHASSLHAGQVVPPDQRWHGCPAQPTSVNYRTVAPAWCGPGRRALFGAAQLVNVLLGVPAVITVSVSASRRFSGLIGLARLGPLAVTRRGFYGEPLVISLVVFFGGGLIGLGLITTLPRLLQVALRPGRVYPLYGFAYWAYRAIARATSAPFFVRLYGDSSYIVGYLRAVGYRAARRGQTGSNFGADVTHETPYLVSVGVGTMVSDGVGFLTASFSHESFQVSPVSIGSRSFLGNSIVVPSGGRLGDNCFVGTKTMIPIDGQARENVGLLGSPPFEIPRTAQRSHEFDLTRSEFRQRLAAKNSYNLRTMAFFLGIQWFQLYLMMLLSFAAIDFYGRWGVLAIAAGGVAITVVGFAYSAVVERVATSFRALKPQYCSIYDPYFWWHERFWKLSTQPALLNGTPLKGIMWRLLGVRIGRRVFDDGCGISEKSLVRIGDDAVLNAGTTLQSHSMEDGIFKSDHIVIGSGCSIGSGAFIHYGVTVGEGASLGADSFLMKGEDVPPHSRWLGNPAQEIVGAVSRDDDGVRPAPAAVGSARGRAR